MEYVIDRSLRVNPSAGASWPEERRQTFLIRQDVSTPLSFDARVTPKTLADSFVPTIDLLATVVARPSQPKSLLETEGEGIGDELSTAEWSLIGYDVCDDAGTSALMNFGRPGAERLQLSSRWEASLNAFHLFSTLSNAEAFRGFASDRYPEHAPFSVIGLYVPRENRQPDPPARPDPG